ncbi:MAG: hypothetical protein JNM56_11555 [Planctomycetia bacterium]|nr:hypothetical protein [Planctomycetia bacterium]
MNRCAKLPFLALLAGLLVVDLAAGEDPPSGPAGVKGVVIRPARDKAQVDGCHVSKPGDYQATVGDLIELEYSYPVVPTAMPKKVDFKVTLIGAVAPSPLGIRKVVTPQLIGAHTLVFFFEAKKAGEDTVTVEVDGKGYPYKFKVLDKGK